MNKNIKRRIHKITEVIFCAGIILAAAFAVFALFYVVFKDSVLIGSILSFFILVMIVFILTNETDYE